MRVIDMKSSQPDGKFQRRTHVTVLTFTRHEFDPWLHIDEVCIEISSLVVREQSVLSES
jgi:hypothetical protein